MAEKEEEDRKNRRLRENKAITAYPDLPQQEGNMDMEPAERKRKIIVLLKKLVREEDVCTKLLVLLVLTNPWY